jgi:hypothetical protein
MRESAGMLRHIPVFGYCLPPGYERMEWDKFREWHLEQLRQAVSMATLKHWEALATVPGGLFEIRGYRAMQNGQLRTALSICEQEPQFLFQPSYLLSVSIAQPPTKLGSEENCFDALFDDLVAQLPKGLAEYAAIKRSCSFSAYIEDEERKKQRRKARRRPARKTR